MDDRSEFFAVLDQLTLSQIEAQLSSWDDDQLKWVGEYLEQKTMKPAEGKKGAQGNLESAAFVTATKANMTATVALIIAIGAMIAAVAAGLVAFQALQH